MIILDTTIVNIALPTAQRSLAFSNADRPWVVTSYSLAFGSLLLLGGRISDVVGRRRALILGLVGFVVGSALGGAASSFTMLVIARTIQGAFAALLAPVVLTLLTTTFTDPKDRGVAFGIYGAIAGTGGAIGLLLGGLLTSYVSWRWTLFVNVAMAPIPIVGAALLLSNERTSDHDPLDVSGLFLVTAGLFSLVFGFSHAQTTSWADHYTAGFLALGAVLLSLFVYRQAKIEHPLLPLRVLSNRTRGGSLLTLVFAGAGTFGIFLFLTYYLQTILGFSPVKTGLAFLPLVGALVLVAQISNGWLLTKVGPKRVVPSGMLFAALALFGLHRLGLHSSYGTSLLPSLIAVGVGLGLSVAPSFSTATLGVEPRDAAVASATVSTAQQVGGSIGTALLNTLAGSASAAYLSAALLSGRVASPVLERAAEVRGFTAAFFWSGVIFVIGAIVTGCVLPRGELQGFGERSGMPEGSKLPPSPPRRRRSARSGQDGL
jgi:EmrB/QacA subfamily drug resistance transporter